MGQADYIERHGDVRCELSLEFFRENFDTARIDYIVEPSTPDKRAVVEKFDNIIGREPTE